MFASHWPTWTEVNRLHEEMSRLFERGNGNAVRGFGSAEYPPLNLWENEDGYCVEAELPGFELNDLDIVVNGDNQLSVKGERKPPQLEDGTWHRRERGFGKFHRTVELPHDVDGSQVTAELNCGVLCVNLPKRENAKPRRIEVKVS